MNSTNVKNACDTIQDIAQAYDCEVIAFVVPKNATENTSSQIVVTKIDEGMETLGRPTANMMLDLAEGKKPTVEEVAAFAFMISVIVNVMRQSKDVFEEILTHTLAH